MENILDVFDWFGNAALPLFVFLTMFNVGITRKMEDFLQYTLEWRFFLRLLIVNFIVSPLLMWAIL